MEDWVPLELALMGIYVWLLATDGTSHAQCNSSIHPGFLCFLLTDRYELERQWGEFFFKVVMINSHLIILCDQLFLPY